MPPPPIYVRPLRIGWLASKSVLQQACQQGKREEQQQESRNFKGQSGEQTATESCLASTPLQSRVRELKDYTTICSSAPSEVRV